MDIDLGKGIDGTEAANEILKLKEIPILFLSSHTEPEIVEKTESITSYGYVVKNSGLTVLDASIKMAFKLFYAHMNINNLRLNAVKINEKLNTTVKDLQVKEKMLQLITENSPDFIYTLDINLNVIYTNYGVKKLLGYAPEEILNMNIKDLHPDKEFNDIMEIFTERLNDQPPHQSLCFPSKHIKKDGTIIPTTVEARIIFNEKNKPVYVQGYVRNGA